MNADWTVCVFVCRCRWASSVKLYPPVLRSSLALFLSPSWASSSSIPSCRSVSEQRLWRDVSVAGQKRVRRRSGSCWSCFTHTLQRCWTCWWNTHTLTVIKGETDSFHIYANWIVILLVTIATLSKQIHSKLNSNSENLSFNNEMNIVVDRFCVSLRCWI